MITEAHISKLRALCSSEDRDNVIVALELMETLMISTGDLQQIFGLSAAICPVNQGADAATKEAYEPSQLRTERLLEELIQSLRDLPQHALILVWILSTLVETEAVWVRWIRTLKLSRMKLTSLPNIHQLAALPRLEELDLSHNLLQNVDGITAITQLDKLVLASNQLSALPADCALLTNLSWLELSNNQFTALPEINRFSKLSVLHLDNNKFAAESSPRIESSTLTSLSLAGNNLLHIPILQTPRLEHLDLRQNELSTLTDQLSQLNRIQTLNLSENKLSAFSARVPSSLSSIDLSRNRLESVPRQLYRIPTLKHIRLESFSFPNPHWSPEQIKRNHFWCWVIPTAFFSTEYLIGVLTHQHPWWISCTLLLTAPTALWLWVSRYFRGRPQIQVYSLGAGGLGAGLTLLMMTQTLLSVESALRGLLTLNAVWCFLWCCSYANVRRQQQ